MTAGVVQEKIKFNLIGDFCPHCSAKMERALSAEGDIGETTINYAARTVYLPLGTEDKAQKIIAQIEPGVTLVPVKQPNQGGKIKYNDKPEKKPFNMRLVRIAAAVALLVVGMLYEEQWHNAGQTVLEYAVFLTGYLLVGYEVVRQALRNILRGSVFDENFLMSIATIGAIAIHQLPEAVGVMLFYSVGEYFQERAVNRSRTSIKALLDIRPDYANLLMGSEVQKVDPEEVVIGQHILVRPGEKVPLDGEVTEGSSFLDTSALTGESVPRRVEVGDTVLAGMINTTGVLTLRVVRHFAESSVQKILDLVENASSRKAETEKFITTFARYYTPAVVFIAAAIAIIPPLLMDGSFQDWLYRALTVLVISCPCALVISVPLGYFGGIGGASKQGILVKGANFLEALTHVKTVVFDKTGTLTQGVFDVVEIRPCPDYSEDTLLELAAAAEIHSSHPIAVSIRKRYTKNISPDAVQSYEEVAGKGIKAIINQQTILVGKASLLRENGIELTHPEITDQAGTVVYIAAGTQYAGYLLIADRIKAGSREAVQKLGDLGINTVMLTGDHEAVAGIIAEDLGIGSFYADLLPEDKVSQLERVMQSGRDKARTVFVGDGINDAPVLSRADIGIAMGGLGSDAAIEAADVVLMEDDPRKILTAIEISRYTKKIIWQNIGFALFIKLGFIILGMFGVANMWEAVFADVGVALLAILNATRVLRYAEAEKPALSILP